MARMGGGRGAGASGLLLYFVTFGWNLVRDSEPKINIVEKRLPNLLPLNFKFKWTNTWHKDRSTKEV